MEQDEYRARLLTAYAVARTIRLLPLAAMLDAIDRADAAGPILDPTAYLQHGAAMREDGSVLRALYRARLKLDELPWPGPAEALP